MMKRILLVIFMVLLVSATVSAQLPPRAYIGFYADVDHNIFCINGTGAYTLYCYVLPSEGGLDSVEFKTVASANLIVYLPVFNPDISLSMGNVPGDLAAVFETCWLDWTLVFSANLMVSGDGTAEDAVTFEPYTGSTYLKVVDCDAVESELVEWTNLFVNYAECPGHANRESTWGAIKNMYE